MSASAARADELGGRSPGVSAAAAKPRRALPVGRILAFVGVWLGGSWLVVGTLLAPVLPGGWLTVLALPALAIVPVRALLRGFAGEAYPSARMRLGAFRPFWYAMLFLPLLAVVGLLGAVAGLPFAAAGLVGRWAIGVVAVLLAAAALAGWVGSRRLVVRPLDVEIPDLPRGLDGLRIVQVSDLHVGPHTSRRFLARVADAVRRARPDLIAITGDQVDDFAQDVRHFVAAFDALTAPLGVFAVPGNHDVYAGWHGVQRGLEEMEIEVLVNRAVPVMHNGDRLWVAGTGDPAGRQWPGRSAAHAAPDIDRTLSGIPEGETTLALAHNPALWPELARRGVDLTLSGHTHYGQFALPSRGWSLASAFLDLAMGSHREGDSLLYINPGTNFWGIPFRIGAYPEVTVLTLRGGARGRGATR